ncbi:MAG: antitoxin [Propionibacteriaceae bacterium]|jgi:antitoxin VapB|nr:antitoxin [Propionibacteriaceae bacterium]
MATGTVFYNNTTQAVRLPKAVAWDPSVTEVTIQVVGDQRILTPKGAEWDVWFDAHSPVSSDFMASREQPEPEQRPAL